MSEVKVNKISPRTPCGTVTKESYFRIILKSTILCGNTPNGWI